MANLHIDENTEIGDTGFTLKQVLNDIGALYTRTNKISSEMINMSKIIIGEFDIFLGNKYFISDGTWQYLGDNYTTYGSLITKFPLRDGYKRSYKLCIQKTDSFTVEGIGFYVTLFNWYTQEHVHDFIFGQTWGGSGDGVMTYFEIDFDINLIKNMGHTLWKTTPSFSLGSGYAWRIYRLYLKVIDTYTGVAF